MLSGICSKLIEKKISSSTSINVTSYSNGVVQNRNYSSYNYFTKNVTQISLVNNIKNNAFNVCSNVFNNNISKINFNNFIKFTPITFSRNYVTAGDIITIKVPAMGESINEGTVTKWLKAAGESVKADEKVVEVETDKVVLEVTSPEAGVVVDQLAKIQEVVKIGRELFHVKVGATSTAAPKKEAAQKEAAPTEAPKKQDTPAPPKQEPVATPVKTAEKPTDKPAEPHKPLFVPKTASTSRGERREPMSRLRQTVAKNMKEAQNTAACLTTFQDCDMTNLTTLRDEFKDEFLVKHGVKLGFMSGFIKAAATALVQNPVINAYIDGEKNEIVYRDFVDISVAVAGPRGLVVPVIRDADKLSFADIEKYLGDLAAKAKNNQLTKNEMVGGSFTISNGGVYGSLMGTPILNPPQSAILGMHSINKRPVVVKDQIVIRSMMYLALTYDHRLIDGRDAVTFLKKKN